MKLIINKHANIQYIYNNNIDERVTINDKINIL